MTEYIDCQTIYLLMAIIVLVTLIFAVPYKKNDNLMMEMMSSTKKSKKSSKNSKKKSSKKNKKKSSKKSSKKEKPVTSPTTLAATQSKQADQLEITQDQINMMIQKAIDENSSNITYVMGEEMNERISGLEDTFESNLARSNISQEEMLMKKMNELREKAGQNNFDKLTANESYLSGVKFSKNWTAYPDNKTDGAEISNDINGFKKLMIVGNKSAGGVRKVGIWDELNVHGKLTSDMFCIGNTCINENDLKNIKK